MTSYEFDRNRFRVLVHQVCHLRENDSSRLGATKLNKILWFIDVFHFLETGKPLTGERYVKDRFGPRSVHLMQTVRELTAEGVLAERVAEFHGYRQRQFQSHRAPRVHNVFSNDQLALIRDVTDVVCDRHTAVSIRDLSHDDAWNAARYGEEIPYYAIRSPFAAESSEDFAEWASSVGPSVARELEEGSLFPAP